jgi:hypothetical protein
LYPRPPGSPTGADAWFCPDHPPGIYHLIRISPQGRTSDMCVLFAFLLFTALIFGLGFALHVLWWIAFIFLIFWLIGLAVRPRGGRWYYW